MKYYKTDFIDRINLGDDGFITDELMDHIKEMIQLDNHIHLDNKVYTLITTDSELAEFIASDKINNCKKIYKPSFVFFSTRELSILKDMEIEVITIPEYYFATELKEVGEV